MALSILVRKEGGRLVPFDAIAADEVASLPAKPILVSITQPRSLPFDRLYRACLKSICESGGYDKGTDAFHELTKTLASFVEVDVTPAGQAITRTKSIAHKPTDAASFRQFFDNAINAWRDSGYWDFLAPDLRAQLERGER